MIVVTPQHPAGGESSAVLELQRRTIEKSASRRRSEPAERDRRSSPTRMHYFFDQKSFARPQSSRLQPRDRAARPVSTISMSASSTARAKKADRPILLERRVMVPDFWNDDLRLSTLILATDMQLLAAPLVSKQQGEQAVLRSGVPRWRRR